MSLEMIKWQEVSWTAPSTSRTRRATMPPLSPMSTIPEIAAPRKKTHCPSKIPTIFRSNDKASSSSDTDSLAPLRGSESEKNVSQSKVKGRIHTFQRASGEWLSIVSFLGGHCDAPKRHGGVIGRAL